MAIAFGSINTGLPKNIVEQIMNAERTPIKKMEERKGHLGEQLKLVNEFKGLIEKLRTDINLNASAQTLRELQVITNEDMVEVTADKSKALPGSYQFEVVQLAQKSSVMSSGFEDPDDSYVGVGYIQYTLPDGTNNDIYIDSDNSSLRKIATLINQNRDSGFRATVVNDGSGSDAPWRIILSLEKTGDDQDAEWPYFYLVDGEDDLYLEFERPAHDAIVKLDGFEIEVPENKVVDLIPGLTIDLKRAKEGEEFTIQITEDTRKIADKVEGIIEGINGVLQFIITQNQLDEKSDTRKTLGGDITLQTIESKLRSLIFESVPTSTGPRRLGDLGISFQKSGLLQFERNRFESFIEKDFSNLSELFHGRFEKGKKNVLGIIDRLKGFVDSVLQFPNGSVVGKQKGIQSRVEQIDRQIADKERMLSQKERNLKDKFSRLEGTISRIRNSGAGLAALGGQTDPVTQLGGQ